MRTEKPFCSRNGMNSSVASTGWWPNHPPRTTRASRFFFSSVIVRPPCRSMRCRSRRSPRWRPRTARPEEGQRRLHGKALVEGGGGLPARGDVAHEVDDLVREGVLVAEAVPGG